MLRCVSALPAEREGNYKEGEVVELEVAEVTLSMLDLREHKLQPSRHRKRNRRKRRMEGCRGEAEGECGLPIEMGPIRSNIGLDADPNVIHSSD